VIDEIFTEPVIEGDLIFAFNKGGIFWPGQNVNTMDFWWTKQALKVKAANDFTMEIPGVAYEDKTVMLQAGYNYMPVLTNEPVDAQALFNQIEGDLNFAFDIANSLVYWPAGELYTLSVLEPGTGYLVNTFNACEADFGNVTKSSSNQSKQHVNMPNYLKSTGLQHVLVVAPEALRGMKEGNVLAVETDDGITVGTTMVKDVSQPAILIANGDDPLTENIDGFVKGDEIAKRLGFNLEASKGTQTASNEQKTRMDIQDGAHSTVALKTPQPSAGFFSEPEPVLG